MLDNERETYLKCAAALHGYEEMSKTDLANGFIKAEEEGNETMRSAYYSALALRYWYVLGKYYADSKQSFTMEDCYNWFTRALLRGLRGKAWLTPGKSVYNDPNGPDKVLNRCFVSERLGAYQESNTFKKKLNYNNESIDRLSETLGDGFYDDKYVTSNECSASTTQSLVQMLINRGKIVEAFIVDGIANQDTFTIEEAKVHIDGKEYVTKNDFGEEVTAKLEDSDGIKAKYEFSNKKLVKHLNNLANINFIKYFKGEYDIEDAVFVDTVKKLNGMSNNRLYKLIEKTLSGLQEDKGVKDLLC